MTVTSDTAQSGPYTPDGSSTVFPFTFKALTTDEVQVYVTTATGNAVLTSGFTITLTDQGGSVVFATAPAINSGLITIASNPDFTQEVNISNQGPFLPAVLNEVFDRSAIRDILLRNRLTAILLIFGIDLTTLANSTTAQLRVIAQEYFKGDPGGNAMAVGLWNSISGQTIPVGVNLIVTTGESSLGAGSWFYVRDTDQTTGAGITQFRKQDAAGSWFKKVLPTEVLFPQAIGGTDTRGVSYFLDVAKGSFFVGGTDTSPQNDEQGYWNDITTQLGRSPTVNDIGVYADGAGRGSYPLGDYSATSGGHDNLPLGVASEAGGAGSSAGAAVAARFTASIAATTMTVTDVDWGTIVTGKILRGTSVSAGTTIVAQLTTTAVDDSGNPVNGAEGTYQVSASQTVGSTSITLGNWADAATAFIGYCAKAFGKGSQAVGEKAVALGELCLSWARAGFTTGYMALAKRGLAPWAIGANVTSINGAGTAGCNLIAKNHAVNIGSGPNPGSPSVNDLAYSTGLSANSLRPVVLALPGSNADGYRGDGAVRGDGYFLRDVNTTKDVKAGADTVTVTNTGSGGYADRHMKVLQAGVLVDAMTLDPVNLFPTFAGDRIRRGTARTIPTSTSTGVAGEECWDTNYLYICTATNTWKRTAWVDTTW